MSRIDDLIAELCPDGVEFRAIADCVVRPHGIRWSEHLGEQFQYIDLTSVDRVTHKIVDTATITSEDAPSRAQQIVRTGDVIFGTTRPTLKRYAVMPPDYDGQICSTGFCVLRPDTKVVLTSYLFHLLGTRGFSEYTAANERGGSYPAISDSLVKSYRIPVPPLELQREIVKVMDTFTELDAELEAELEARRRQYGYYATALLESGDSVPRVKLGAVAKIVRGASPRPINAFISQEVDGVPWIKIGDVAAGGKYITRTAQRVTPAGAAKSRRVHPGDFVLSNSMSFGRPYISRIEGCIHDGWLAISDFNESFDSDYLYHLLRSGPIQTEFARRAGAGAVQNLNADIVKAVSVPMPAREAQLRVVELLDKFDVLVNDLSVGLPAELAARRKQYEYYRDRLLTFEEAAA